MWPPGTQPAPASAAVSRAGSMEALYPHDDESHGGTREVHRRASGAGGPAGGRRRRDPATRTGALPRIGEQVRINPETLRNWVTQAEIDEVTGQDDDRRRDAAGGAGA